jgi:hypothetical protein
MISIINLLGEIVETLHRRWHKGCYEALAFLREDIARMAAARDLANVQLRAALHREELVGAALADRDRYHLEKVAAEVVHRAENRPVEQYNGQRRFMAGIQAVAPRPPPPSLLGDRWAKPCEHPPDQCTANHCQVCLAGVFERHARHSTD